MLVELKQLLHMCSRSEENNVQHLHD